MAGRSVHWEKKFERYLTGETWNNEEDNTVEHRAFCPFHEDPETSKSPSAAFNFTKGVFVCFQGCRALRIPVAWSMLGEDEVQGTSKVRDITSAKSAGKPAAPGKLPSEVQVRTWHQRLMKSAKQLADLMNLRGLTAETLKEHEIGWDGHRYTIPVRDGEDTLVNVRRYALGNVKQKVISFERGTGSSTIFGQDAFEQDEILLCEGEMDMLIARQFGFNSMTGTTGADAFPEVWYPRFKGKRVFIVYDNDKAGERGAAKVAGRLRMVEADVYVVKLPVAKSQDLTDYFVEQGYTAENLRDLLAQTPPFDKRTLTRKTQRKEPIEATLIDTMRGDLVEQPLRVVATVAGKVQPPYAFPKKAVLTCARNWGPKCEKCPMDLLHGGQLEHEVARDDKVLLRMIDKPEKIAKSALLEALDIPPACPVVQVDELETHTVEHLILVPNVDDQESSSDNIRREVFNVGSHNTPLNSTVILEGQSTADPRHGRLAMQTWSCKETKTSLDTFEMSDQAYEDLQVFQPKEGQGVLEKLEEIADDIAANVTHIYGRPYMHIAYDLVWHSVLDFRFRNANVGKGWLELLVVGDTRTGKSEAAQRLCRHYQNGILTSCEGATLAGLLGGAQQVAQNWVITWGTIPLHDRRLVVLDEVSGLKDKNILENMSEVRSSGRAKVTKIVSAETNARTRLIWISNPADGRAIADMPRGAIDAIVDLIPTPEDIARFDMAMVAAKDDVKSSIINAARPPKVEQVFTTELCSQLVLWAWSRKAKDIVYDKRAERLTLRLAEMIGQRYVPDPPLLQAENARMKLARMSVAIAARLFSTDETGEKVVVTTDHVRAARAMLDKLYRMPRFGYAQYSRQVLEEQAIARENKERVWSYLRKSPGVFEGLRATLLDTQFRQRDFQDFGGMDQDMATHAVGELMKMRMVRRMSKGYIRMQPELIDVVRQMDVRDRRNRH